MSREPSVETERAATGRPGADAPDATGHGFGRSRQSTDDEKRRLAREQGEAIASGRAGTGHTVLRTPFRRGVFICGLMGIVVLALAVAVLG